MEKDFREILKAKPVFDEEILRAAEEGKLIFFLGAGVSRIMGVQGWDGFSESLIRKAFSEYKDQMAIIRDIKDSKERITIAYKKFEDDGNLEEFYSCFGAALKPNLDTFNSKKNIYKILSQFDATFLSTNADNLFEDILGHELCHEDCKTADINDVRIRRQSRLFYLHGHYTDSIDIYKNNLVFTAPQYVERYNDGGFKDFLEATFQNNNVILFIGYGLNEFEIMDYIVTKAGHSQKSPQKVYVLYGFCENDEIIFRAKKSYFEALNIKMIPFDMSINGYDSLIDVLESLYEDYRKRTVVPTSTIIHEAINEFNDENCAFILHCLKDDDKAKTMESEIVREVQKIQAFEWVEEFNKSELFSSAQMDKKIEAQAWPLLELLSDWVKTDDSKAQDAAINFLNQITEEQKEKLAERYTYINKHIVETVLSLDKRHIESEYIDLIETIVAGNNLFYHEVHDIKNVKRILQWKNNHIQKLLDYIFRKVDFDDYHDNQSYVIEQFFKKYNSAMSSERHYIFTFNYFVQIVKTAVDRTYSRFLEIRNVDNIYKNHQEYWKLILDEIKLGFSKTSRSKQYELLERLMREDNEACWKLVLYLARKYDHNIVEQIKDNAKILASYACYHEVYMLLKHHMEKMYLSTEMQNVFCRMIDRAKFGIDKYAKTGDDDYYNNLILEKRLTLLQLLTCEEVKLLLEDYAKKGIQPYPSEEVAEQCDYVHSGTWINEVQFSLEMFEVLPLERWIKKYEEVCCVVKEGFALSDCARQFIGIVLERTEEEINCVLKSFKELTYSLLPDVIDALYSKRDSLQSYDVLIDTCLNILEELLRDKEINIKAASSIFRLLSDVEITSETMVMKTLTVIEPWLNISVGCEDVFVGPNHLLDNLINYGDFHKYSVLINCYVSLKKHAGHELSDDEVSRLVNLLKKDGQKNIYRHTLGYNYQNLKYIAQGKAIAFSEALLGESTFDMTTLMLCILNSSYVFDELGNAIRENYLSGRCSVPEECKGRIIKDRLFEFIIASCYYKKLTMREFEVACDDTEFVDHFLRSITLWSKKEDFVLEDWLIPCWEKVKNKFGDKKQQYVEVLLHSIESVVVPSKKLLDLYLEAVACCERHAFVHVKIERVLEFCSVDVNKSLKLAQALIEINDFVGNDELIVFAQKCVEVNRKDNARMLLNWLSDQGRISLSKKEEIARILKVV